MEVLTTEQKSALIAEIGTQAAAKVEILMLDYKQKAEAMLTQSITKEKFEEYQTSIKASVEELKGIAATQGKGMNEILGKLDGTDALSKTIESTLKADDSELRRIYQQGVGVKEYMLSMDKDGNYKMMPFDRTKAAGPTATVANVGTSGNTASVSQSIDATTLLRLGGNAMINSQYRNSPWIFDMVNLVNAGMDQMFAMYFNELPKQGSSALVLEGATKPTVQYAYQLISQTYKKEAMLVQFTEEFNMDFKRLQDDIIAKSRIDLINRINSAILPNIFAAATAFNTGATYAPTGDQITAPNDWDVIAALAAQSETATFTSQANTAVISTNKKYRMGTLRASTAGTWLDRPDVFDNLAFVSNPSMGTSNVMVGDLKQYNIILRGGIIVKVGYNGTDFAENKFSTVIEQYYFDYISDARKPAIVKGPDFQTVKAAITA